MVEAWQIACVCKTDRTNPYDCIERAGGPEGEGWTLRVDEIVTYIKEGTRFWVDVGGQRMDVIIASHSGREYIKTRADADQPTTLLSLPECIE